MTRVTEKQEKFLKNIVFKGMSQRDAYRDAYCNQKMSDKSVDECACKLLKKNTKVISRLNELKMEKEGVEDFGLSLREEKYVEGLILGQSQRISYRNAFNCKNFTDKTVDEKASRLFKTDKIQARLKQLRNRIISEIEKDAIMDGKEILEELTKTARSSLGDVLKVNVKNGEIDITLKDNFDMRNVKEMYLDRNGNLRVKMHSHIDAMKILADLQNVKEEGLRKDQEIQITMKPMEGMEE